MWLLVQIARYEVWWCMDFYIHGRNTVFDVKLRRQIRGPFCAVWLIPTSDEKKRVWPYLERTCIFLQRRGLQIRNLSTNSPFYHLKNPVICSSICYIMKKIRLTKVRQILRSTNFTSKLARDHDSKKLLFLNRRKRLRFQIFTIRKCFPWLIHHRNPVSK